MRLAEGLMTTLSACRAARESALVAQRFCGLGLTLAGVKRRLAIAVAAALLLAAAPSRADTSTPAPRAPRRHHAKSAKKELADKRPRKRHVYAECVGMAEPELCDGL